MATIKQVVRAEVSATIVTDLKVGDVYKRVESSGYGDPKLLFGVVTDIMASGDELAITTLEFASEYGGAYDPALKVWLGSSDLAIFPATLDEFDVAHGEAIRKQELTVETAERDLTRKTDVLARMRQVSAAAATSTTSRPPAIVDVDLPDGDEGA